jgi:hypothetical protein
VQGSVLFIVVGATNKESEDIVVRAWLHWLPVEKVSESRVKKYAILIIKY